ncbi:MAG TPA: hypothetical protein VK421_04425 [Pyrinomonadaceae bacterium]|nr:hypothetical protein [Pyrinomonadaceae bacterium]
MKTIKLIAATLALAVGFTAGFYAVRKVTKREDPSLRHLREAVEMSAPLHRQYREGDYAQAKEALLALASRYDSFDAGSATPLNPYSADAKMCYARLAMMEERHGRSGEAAMGEAVRRCERLKSFGGHQWNCSAEYLRAEVARMDALPLYELKD